MEISITPIGRIETPFDDLINMPIQPIGAEGIKGKVILEQEYKKGLKDLEGFSHIILVFFFHKSDNVKLTAKPYLEETEHGIFATRGPSRPSHIGVSVVKLNRIEENVLHISNVDMLNGTPLLDIKPYVPQFDNADKVEIGWLAQRIDKADTHRADDRFLK